MKYLNRWIVAATLTVAFFYACPPVLAQWQVPDHAVPIGRGTGTGFKSATPGTSGQPLVSNGASTDPSFQGIGNAGIAPGAANTVKGSLNGTTTSDLAIASCSAIYQFTQWVTGSGWQCGLIPVLPSRAIAATLNLSAFSAVQTLGYAQPGDGGGATFQKIVGSFIDAKVLTGTVTTVGTCTNGSYPGVQFTGGSGTGFTATVTVAGGVMTLVTPKGTQGQGYTVGNVLTPLISSGGVATVTCTVAPTWTIATISTPTGSFTDSAGNKLQIIRPPGGIDPRAFGYKNDYTEAGGDAAATDNFTPLTNALNFASTWSVTIPDRGGTQGGVVLLPQYAGMYCGNGNTPLLIPGGVSLIGQGEFSSVIKPCDSWNSNINWIELCDSTAHYSCFGAKLTHMQLYVSPNQDTGSSGAGVAAIYSNNVQDTVIIDHVKIYSGKCRRGIWLDVGYGGTTYNTLQHFGVFGGGTAANCGGTANALIYIDYGTTQVKVIDFSGGGFSAGSGGPRDNGLAIAGGFVSIDGYHVEQIVNPILIDIPGGLANGMVSAVSLIGGVDCVGLVTLIGTNTQGNFILRPPMALNGCTRMVTNGQSGGVNLTGPAINDTIFNP